MSKARLEAFSDGVIAILITVLVLELKLPRGDDWPALQRMLPAFGTYALSFVFVGIYWNNHHHLLHITKRINGGILWANHHLLFWLSLVPFATAWMAESHFAPLPTALYGGLLFMCGVAFSILQAGIIAEEGPGSALKAAVGRNLKGKVSVALYASAILLSFSAHWISLSIYVAVALLWLVPDRRIESKLADPRP